MSAVVVTNTSHVVKGAARSLFVEFMYAKRFAMQGIALLVRRVGLTGVDVVV